jgi:uncharacterized protein
VRRAVLDPNVFVSALITPAGTSAALVAELQRGELEVIASPLVLSELEGVLRREKFRCYADLESVDSFLEGLRIEATVVPDPTEPAPIRSVDPKDDYLLALAFHQKSRLVSGDSDLLELSGGAPICSPGDLLSTEPA